MTVERKPAGIDGENKIFDVEALAPIGKRSRMSERQPLAAALRAEAREFEPGRLPAEQPPVRLQRDAARRRAEVEIAGIGAGRRRQFDVADRLSADPRPGETGDTGHDPGAPDVAEPQVDLEAVERAGADA